MKYIPSEQELTVIVHFWKMKVFDNIEPQFCIRNMIADAVENCVNDSYLLYHATSLFDSLINKVHVNNHTVLLKNGTIVSFEDVISFASET